MGNYVESNLTKDEKIVYEAKFHWFIFISFKIVLFLPIIDFLTSEFVITNKRIIMKVGLISRRTMEINISKVESVNVDQGVLGRVLGYGTISIVGTGGSRSTFTKIANPLAFRKAFQDIQ
jgi:uncharacterized membrane protein YdbT with pleckstrin-like domain